MEILIADLNSGHLGSYVLAQLNSRAGSATIEGRLTRVEHWHEGDPTRIESSIDILIHTDINPVTIINSDGMRVTVNAAPELG